VLIYGVESFVPHVSVAGLKPADPKVAVIAISNSAAMIDSIATNAYNACRLHRLFMSRERQYPVIALLVRVVQLTSEIVLGHVKRNHLDGILST
jgi:hypothetical protein